MIIQHAHGPRALSAHVKNLRIVQPTIIPIVAVGIRLLHVPIALCKKPLLGPCIASCSWRDEIEFTLNVLVPWRRTAMWPRLEMLDCKVVWAYVLRQQIDCVRTIFKTPRCSFIRMLHLYPALCEREYGTGDAATRDSSFGSSKPSKSIRLFCGHWWLR